MSRKTPHHIIQISNPDASKRSGVIVLNQADEEKALEVARKLALATGRCIILRDDSLAVIETIPAAGVH